MIAVIFEATAADGMQAAYLDIAANLLPVLKRLDGFISIERFQSINNPGKVLSLSFWRDETGIEKWRNMTVHREAQASGRKRIFSDYRIRVAAVIRDYSEIERAEAPKDSNIIHQTNQ